MAGRRDVRAPGPGAGGRPAAGRAAARPGRRRRRARGVPAGHRPSGHLLYAPQAARDLGLELLYTARDPQGAYAAWKSAVDSGHPEYGPLAGVHLGKLLHDGCDTESARRVWQWVVDSRHPVVGPEAAQNLRLTAPPKKGWFRRG